MNTTNIKQKIELFLEQKLYNKKTYLCDIMKNNNSDKSTKHNFTTIYSYLFDNIKNSNCNIFELGLGTNNINLPSNMGTDGVPGASHYGWKEYFKNSNIYGADIDKTILINDKIKSFYCDQTDKNSIDNLWNNPELKDIKFDIIIDDGLHVLKHNFTFFINSIHKLNDNGIYIIEDIRNCEIHLIDKIFNNINNINLVKIPVNNDCNDNNLIIITKYKLY